MSELRGRGELLSSDQEKAALARLLGNDSSAVRSCSYGCWHRAPIACPLAKIRFPAISVPGCMMSQWLVHVSGSPLTRLINMPACFQGRR